MPEKIKGLTTHHKWDFKNLHVDSSSGSQNKPVRLDSDIASKAELFNQFGNQGQLMFDIMYFIALNSQYNFDLFTNTQDQFTGGVFDIEEFCKTMGYSKKWLWDFMTDDESAWLRRHPRRTGKTDVFYRRKIGDALFRLHTENISFRRNNPSDEYEEDSVSVGISMLNALKIKASGDYRRKTIVKYVADKDFFLNMMGAFTLLHTDTNIRLRKPRLSIPYASFKSLLSYMDKNNKTAWDYNLDKALELFRIDMQRPSNSKQRLRQKLIRLQEESDLPFTFEFYNKSGKYDYGLMLYKTNAPLNVSDNKLALKDAFDQQFAYSLHEVYCEMYPFRKNMESFQDWVNNPSFDIEIKIKSFKVVYQRTFKTSPDNKIINDYLLKINKDTVWDTENKKVSKVKKGAFSVSK